MNITALVTDANAWAALVTLTALEIVLGIDNLVFISVLTARLDADGARRARQIGLSLAFVFRLIMLLGLTWLMRLTNTALQRTRHGRVVARHHPGRRRDVPHCQSDT
jgi:predicted tellurium resistance membrane protein TerC